MNFENPQPLELSAEHKEQIKNFEKELMEAVESIAGLTETDFVEQNAEMFGEGEEGEDVARQMYNEMEFPLRGFESWDEEISEEMLKKFQEQVLHDYTLVDSFTNEDSEEVEVMKTENSDMQVLRIKDETGNIEWILKPIEGKINK